MKRRHFIMASSSLSAAGLVGLVPGQALAAPEPIATTKLTIGSQAAEARVYRSRNKGAYIVAILNGKNSRWVELTASDRRLEAALQADTTVWSVGSRDYRIVRDGDILTVSGPDDTPVATFDGGVGVGLAVVAVTLIVLAVVWYASGEEANEAVKDAANTISETTGDGVWNDGSERCNPGPFDPPFEC